MPAGLPDFRALTEQVYQDVDSSMAPILNSIPRVPSGLHSVPRGSMEPDQYAEALRFARGDYDVVLGMLARRMDSDEDAASSVRQAVVKRIRTGAKSHAAIHEALIKLADRGGSTSIVTTNFDLLLQAAAKTLKVEAETYSLGGIPRPSHRRDFQGILHIHGVIEEKKKRHSEIVITDRDLGDYYLRRRIIPDFIYDASRLYHLVLVGYSANDAPMRYLLNAVAADGARFGDLKERFAFVGMSHPFDEATLEDWKGRGITPIPYSEVDDHGVLGKLLVRWADLSPHLPSEPAVDSEVKRITAVKRSLVSQQYQDLFDHFIRRGNAVDASRIAREISATGSDFEWQNAISAVLSERRSVS